MLQTGAGPSIDLDAGSQEILALLGSDSQGMNIRPALASTAPTSRLLGATQKVGVTFVHTLNFGFQISILRSLAVNRTPSVLFLALSCQFVFLSAKLDSCGIATAMATCFS